MSNFISNYRILLIIDGIQFGGGEMVFLQIASRIGTNFKISVAAMPGGGFEAAIQRLNIEFFPVDTRHQLSIIPIIQLHKIIRKNKINLVHSQGARADFFARIASHNVKNVCTIAMPVEGFDVSFFRKLIYRFFDFFSEKFVNHFIVVSESLKRLLVENRRLPTKNVTKIYNGIELNHFISSTISKDILNKVSIQKTTQIIAGIGRLVWQKGFIYLIEAAVRILDEMPDIKFIIIGDGPLRENLENLTRQKSVEQFFTFTGFRDDIKEILSVTDIVSIPSLQEGFPMITLEAMAMAKPIVATNIPGIDEQITDNKDGILVPPKNSTALSNAIIELLIDRKKARKIGIEARKTVEKKFSVEKMIAETEKVYFSLLQ